MLSHLLAMLRQFPVLVGALGLPFFCVYHLRIGLALIITWWIYTYYMAIVVEAEQRLSVRELLVLMTVFSVALAILVPMLSQSKHWH